MKPLLLLSLLVVPPISAKTKSEIYHRGTLSLAVDSITSVAPEGRVGFSKTLPVYRVIAHSDTTSYITYCLRTHPESGSTYTGMDAYVSGNFSELHTSPVEKHDLGIEGKGRLYHVVTFQNVTPASTHPDLACDIASVTAR